MSERTAPFPEKDQPLRDEVRFLGALLGEVILEQEGSGLFSEVEEIRRDAIDRRRGDAAAELRLVTRISALPPARLTTLIEAFSAYFSLVNQAERIHRIRRGREHRRSGSPPQRGSIEAILSVLRDRGATREGITQLLESLRVEPVFTAHPTEAIRPEILGKEQRIARALLDGLEGHDPAPSEELSLRDRIVTEIATAWQTDGTREVKPQVSDEVDQIVFLLTQAIYRVLPRFYEEVEEALDLCFSDTSAAPSTAVDLSSLLRFASWVGGDMDGNPNAGPETLLAALARHRAGIVARYCTEAGELADRLTQTANRVRIDPELQARLDELSGQNAARPDTSSRVSALPTEPRRPESMTDRSMPYRRFFSHVARRLECTVRVAMPKGGAGPVEGRTEPQQPYADAGEFVADLRLVERSLEQNRGRNAGHFRVRRFRRRAEAFGFHLASIDVRQDALVHRRAVGELLRRTDFVDLPEEERTRLLVTALETVVPGDVPFPGSAARQPLSAETVRTLTVFRAIADARRVHGQKAIGIYIISMARGPDDALAVLYLARSAGLGTGAAESLDVPLDVAPLFETVSDLEAACATLETLFAQEIYRRHVERRAAQHVMLGYSDSSKDSGLAASRWALHRVQASLMTLSDRCGVAVRLFHGRGGTISRGGSRPQAAILAQPKGTVRGHLRVTEQGEVLQAKYGLRGIALRSFELLTAAVLEATAPESRDSFEEVETEDSHGVPPGTSQPAPSEASPRVPPGASQPAPSEASPRVPPGASQSAPRCPADFGGNLRWEVAETIASAAGSVYRALVHDEPDFIPYFRQATPIDVIERLEIGSRPPSRREQKGVADLRAIPWVFAWTQSRLILPGWFGVGTGLAQAVEVHGLDTVRRLCADWRFLETLVGDVETVLSRADIEIAARYAALAGDVGARLFPRIREEFTRTEEMVLTIRDSGDLLLGEPVLRRAIRLRNPYVDPMSFAQVDLLVRWREGGRSDEALLQALFHTVRGIARGLQSTG